MIYEIERKWLLNKDELPNICREKEPIIIEQCYFASKPSVRIRKSLDHRDQFKMTIKGEGTIKRVEIEDNITEETYENLKKFIVDPNGIITKKFWKYKFGEHYVEISLVDDLWYYAEIEFETEEEAKAYMPPEWFKKDVTEIISIKKYSDLKVKLGKAFDVSKIMSELLSK